MNFQTFIKKSVKCIGFAFTAAVFANGVSAQSAGNMPMVLAGSNNLYCAGYVQHSPISVSNKIIGAQEEQDGFMYSEGDVIYINARLQEGQRYSVVRPRGRVKSRWSSKGDLGTYMQEVGAVEVFKSRTNYSVARIVTSCDNFTLGDLIMPWQERVSPMADHSVPFDRFADPSGKAIGRLVMARDNQELITRDQIVFVDLGRDNNVQAGDRLTIFRPLGKGNLHRGPGEAVSARSYGYKSMTNTGGGFSNQAPRKRGENARGKVETHRDARRDRPDIRKVIGEGVILNVKEKVATVVITRTAQEIQTGDFVEVQ